MTAPGTTGWLRAYLEAHEDELVAFRRHLHAHPELSHAEVLTTELIGERLRIAGLAPTVLSSGTGLVCDVGPDDGRADGRRVVLRGDIDALAMHDTTTVPYRSTVPGVAHGCGHDLHTTVVLGAGLALAHQGVGGVRLVFEPAEESVPGGAVTVIADGALEDVDVVFGLHADPKLDVGTVGIRPGPLTAAADIVEIELRGPGGHTARPELTVDLVTEAARIAAALPALVAGDEPGDGGDQLHLVFGALQAGDAANVIPTTALLRGSVRTTDAERWRSAEQAVRAALDSLVEDPRLTVECRYRQGVPPVVNDPEVAERARGVARAVLGADAVVVPPRSRGGDSFAWYLEEVPGCYLRLGVHDPGAGPERLDLHSGAFDVDDRAIAVGIELLVALVLDRLERT